MNLKQIESIPQKFAVWQVGSRQLATAVQTDGETVRPWLTVVANGTDESILALEILQGIPTTTETAQLVEKAILKPETGDPHRPTKIQLEDQVLLKALAKDLDSINVDCESVETLGQIEEVVAQLGHQLSQMSDQAGLLDMPGVTPEAVASFFDAAAMFYERKPWMKSGERPIRVECDKFESSPWYAVLMGQGGMTEGLALYDSLETLIRVQQGEVTELDNAKQTVATAVTFGEREDLVPADAEAIKKYGWRVAGPKAFPSAYRIEPGLSMRPPLVWELELMEGCLRSIPEFVRKKTRRTEPMPVAVPLSSGQLPLVLSWALG